MIQGPNTSLLPDESLVLLANRCALAVMAIGLLGMGGWLFGIDLLTRVMPHFQSVKFNTALGLFSAGAALKYREHAPIRIAIGIALSILGALTLSEYLWEADFGIDQFFISYKSIESIFPGRMSPVTAVCILFSGLVLSGAGRRNTLWRIAEEIMAITLGVIGLLTILGYLLSVKLLYLLPGFASVALPTGIAFLVLSIGLLSITGESLPALLLKTWPSHRPFWFGMGLLLVLLAITGIVSVTGSNIREVPPLTEATKILLFGLLVTGMILALMVTKKVVLSVLHKETALLMQQNELRQNQMDLARAQEIGRIGWWRLNTTRNILTWSDENHRIFSVPKGTPLSFEIFLNLVHPDDRRFVDTQWKSALQGKPYDIEHRIIVDGHVKWVCEKAYLEFEPSGALLGGFGITQDITERKHIEQALAEAENHVRRQRDDLAWIYQNAPIGLCELDLDLRFRRINQVLADINGLPIAAHIGKTVEETVPNLAPVAREINKEILATRLAVKNKEFCGETLAKPGIKRYWNESWFPIFDEQEAITGFGVVVEEITARKKIEDALRMSEERSRLAQSSAHVGIWDWHLPSGNLTWTPELERLYGYAEGTFPGTYENFLARVYPDDIEYMEKQRDEAVNSNQPFDFDFRALLPSGELRWFNCKGGAIYDKAGRPKRILGVNIDITERKLAEEALQDADRRKNEFLAMLGHELRNPLTPLSNVAQIMGMPNLDAQTLKHAGEVLHRNIQHITQLVDDLLDVSRMTRGLIKIHKQRVDLSSLLQESVESIQGLFKTKQQIFHINLPSEPVFVDGDPVRLTQIFTNLLNNAAKYTGEGGQIDLTAWLENPNIHIRVKDNGIGIEADLLPKIFDLFTQSELGLNRSDGGLGIGLTLVKKLVELHGGEIKVHSRGLNQGSEFVIRLPHCAKDVIPEKIANLPDDHYGAIKSLRILLIDDNPDVTDSLATWLDLEGHQVKIAAKGAEGILATENFKPDMIILDIGLPDMDGYQVARRIRAMPRGKELCLIAMSGYEPNPNEYPENQGGFNHYLIKPPPIKRLRQLIAGYQQAKKS